MVPPGQPSKPRARENSVGRERWIASWGTFCVPKTKRLLLTFWKLKVNRKMCTMISKRNTDHSRVWFIIVVYHVVELRFGNHACVAIPRVLLVFSRVW